MNNGFTMSSIALTRSKGNATLQTVVVTPCKGVLPEAVFDSRPPALRGF
jgi:hypothetical protein